MKRVVEKVATDFNLTKKLGKAVVDSVVDGLIMTIKSGDKLRINGLGTFSIKARPARTARHPRTGEKISVPAKRVLKFTPVKDLKEVPD
ncbi:MAG: HU family DNA-binding protein [Desulfuromonas sp.]|nr:HU family DNA-binding protein [Desulfuromonas sp.]